MPIYQPYLNTVQRYFDFEGRTGRQEYWLAVLVHVIIGVVLGIVDGLIFGWEFTDPSVLGSIYTVAVLLPFLGLGARRLHDIGRSGWWMLLAFAIVVGWIILLIWAIQPSDPDENAYGPPPMSPSDMDMDMDPGMGMQQS